MKNWIVVPFVLLLAIGNSASLPAKENVPVPLNHWSYQILHYFATERILTINLQTKPVTREDVHNALEQVREQFVSGTLKLDTVEEDLLSSLYEEFYPDFLRDFRNTPRILYRGRDIILKEEGSIETMLTTNNNGSAVFNLSVWGALGKHISCSEYIRIRNAGKTDMRDTLGTRAFKDFRGTTPTAVINLSFAHFNITAGRNVYWLGPGRFGTLLLSNNYPYFDGINATFNVSSLRFSSYFIVVNVDSNKYISGHRLEIKDFMGFTFGFNECVIYSDRIEPGYLNPLLILYGEQYNRGDRDNIFWSFDISFFLLEKNSIYAEFLIDDFQYESTPPAPNKIGLLAGIHVAEPLGFPRLEIIAEYARISKWVYSHKYSENTYSNYHLPLGHPFGPDAHGFDITLREFLFWNVIPQLHFGYKRKGEGRIYDPWEPGTEPHPPLPSGIIETTTCFDVSLFVKPFASSEFTPGWRTYSIENKRNVLDWKEQDNVFFINLLFTF